MRTARRFAAVIAALALGGCAVGGETAQDRMRVFVPTPPGGGYDMTARILAAAAEDSGVTARVDVVNLPGDRGMAALSRARFEQGDGSLLLQMGLGLLANAHLAGLDDAVDELTPVARVIEEAEAVVVTRDSRYHTLDELVTELREHPARLTVGGGSEPGGPDHLAAMLLARGVGVAPTDVKYRPYDGGGEMLAALLTGDVDFALTGAAENLQAIRAGEVRVLGVTGARRVPGIDAPTLIESGIDVEFMNWRGLLAPPDLTATEHAATVAALEAMRSSPTWQEAVAKHGWTDAFLTGTEFDAFVAAEQRRIAALLDDLGVSQRDDG
ncbi:Bug family tripartite tricarboxylate transporter substrate binding protein [Haloechinothrix salitolerans]|uniref:Bug family tripartite tricarboxylate transporter substrate binding protein n=1 Tax=Haloechinothrix salitolerans TaxID=926830 RepID=A0ABW2C5S2_9PSEU